MPAARAITGQGTAVSFGTTTFTQKVQEVTLSEQMMEMLDVTDLSVAVTSPELKMCGDNYTQSDIVIKFYYDPTKSGPVKPVRTAETLTITPRKINSASASAGTWAGTGYISKVKLPNLKRNEIAIGEVTFTPDGETAFVWTAEA